MKLKSNLRTLYWATIIEAIVMIVIWGGIMTPDSYTYIQAWETIGQGEINHGRTPVYPFFLGVIGNVLGYSKIYLIVVVTLQYALFLYSVRCFYKTMLFLIKNERIVFWIALFYATFPAFTSWNITILTESFALSGSVILMYFIVKTWSEDNLKSVVGGIFWLGFLIFLRPSFIYLLPIMAIFYLMLIIIRKNRPLSFIGVIGFVMIAGSLHLYMKQYQKVYGFYASTNTSVLNQYFIAREYGVFLPEKMSNARLKDYISSSYQQKGVMLENKDSLWSECGDVFKKFSFTEVKDATNQAIRDNFKGYFSGVVLRAYEAFRHPVFKSTINVFKFLFNVIGFSLNTILLLLLLYLAVLFKVWKRSGKFPAISFLLFAITLSNIFVIVIGAQDEWSRLFLPSLPCVLIMVGQLCVGLKFEKQIELI